MSQGSGKVYHVYVEVRDGEGLDPLMGLQGPDVLPQSQRTSPHHRPSPSVSPGTLHKGGGSIQSLASNKSSSRHSVNFQLGGAGLGEDAQGHAAFLGPPPGGPHHRQSLPHDGLGHLLSALQTGHHHNGILMRAHSAESEPFYGPRGTENHMPAGRYTAPPTPSAGRRSHHYHYHHGAPASSSSSSSRGVGGGGGGGGGGGEGRRSVVKFSYIEKGSVQPGVDRVDGYHGSHGSLCHSEPENPFNRALEEEEEALAVEEEEEAERLSRGRMGKRLSDPVHSWEYGGGGGGGGAGGGCYGTNSTRLTSSQRHAMNLRRATLDCVAREATYRALEEFGSPELRRRMEAYVHHPHDDHHQPPPPPTTLTDHYHQQQQQPLATRCRSWGGSPVLPARGAHTLPTNAQLADLDRNHSAYGMPRSPATEHLASHIRQSFYAMSPPPEQQRAGPGRPGCPYRLRSSQPSPPPIITAVSRGHGEPQAAAATVQARPRAALVPAHRHPARDPGHDYHQAPQEPAPPPAPAPRAPPRRRHY